MHKVGLINKWLVDTLPKKDQCWTNTQLEVTNHKVNLDNMQGSFIVLLLGKSAYLNINDLFITFYFIDLFKVYYHHWCHLYLNIN
jgi:hypothetical protein